MSLDFNDLEKSASIFVSKKRYLDAIKIYLHMALGDPSLDAGYLGFKIGECYEKSGDLHAAKYWYGRAVEENPEIDAYTSARDKLSHININNLIDSIK
jgi:tetratricopeptide (TPR) repeat protein